MQLLDLCGVDSRDFFRNKSNPLVSEGWDPSLAYMNEMIKLARPGGPLDDLTREKIRDVAARLEFFPGVPECFDRIKSQIEQDDQFRAAGIRVESYVVSGGIADLLRASSLDQATHRIWACNFAYDESGVIAVPKNVISFTDKTRYLFRINKGLTGQDMDRQPSSVNQPMNPQERPVPFDNMIYIGDGPSDIPCMSLLQTLGGFVIGVTSQENWAKTWALGYGRRANQTVDSDFAEGGFAYNVLFQAVLGRAQSIAGQASGTGPVPQH